ncbi:MAG: HPr family phosphocarrier protein [Myxococcales bacterium]|nr:HPr family phosphocarrier protein [Myxococcales bacterium]
MSKGISRQFTIVNKLGLHARASATLVRVASQFSSEVFVAKDGQAVNGKSILGMMTLAAAKGSTVTVTCDGTDQDKALAAIGEVIANRFGEAE